MTMNTKNLFCAAAIMLGTVFTACTSDISDIKQDDKPAIDDGAKVYLNIDLSMATGGLTRSQTGTDGGSSDGTETGQVNENTISNVMVLLVGHDKNGVDNCFIAKWTKEFSPIEIKDPQTLTADFNRSAFLDHYKAHESEEDNNNKNRVSVYVICNYTPAIDNLVGLAGKNESIDKWLNQGKVDTKENGVDYTKATMPYWQNNKFLMTNATRYESYIPTKEKIEEGKDYNSPGNAFNLTPNGAIEVERAVARFDYAPDIDDKDASNNKISQVKTEEREGKTVYYYEVAIDGTNADGTENPNAEKLKVYLKRMALVNMNRKFYLFRRVSNDGTSNLGENNANKFQICGKETNNNFVIDPEWEFKSNGFTNTTEVSEFENRFFYYVGAQNITDADGITVNNKWDNYEIADILKNPKYDNIYHFWRYVIPNTIPGTNKQRNGISTGVVFKAKIEPTDENKAIGKRMKENYDIFSFKGKVLGSWKDVQDFATAADADPVLKKAYNDAVAQDATLKLSNSSDLKTLNDSQTNAAVKKGGFAKYGVVKGAAEGDGYYCYYYYWNRHNDNGNPNQMGPMEFGVVRNNVYKLHVTSLKRLGHPFRPGNDPDPIKPETPDEETKLYMNLSVKVRPWTVRKNYVDF